MGSRHSISSHRARTATERIQTEATTAGRPRPEAADGGRGQAPDSDNIVKFACDALMKRGATPDGARRTDAHVTQPWGPAAQTAVEAEVIHARDPDVQNLTGPRLPWASGHPVRPPTAHRRRGG